MRKPGAFRNYRYHEDLFPRLQFRKAHDKLCDNLPQRKVDLKYLRILKYAAYNSENDVHKALVMLHELKLLPTLHHVEEFLPQREGDIPAMRAFEVSLSSYDQLIEGARHDG